MIIFEHKKDIISKHLRAHFICLDLKPFGEQFNSLICYVNKAITAQPLDQTNKMPQAQV